MNSEGREAIRQALAAAQSEEARCHTRVNDAKATLKNAKRELKKQSTKVIELTRAMGAD